MIGQNSLLTIIDEQIFMDNFPRFSIIIGQEGSGKKTLAHKISELLKCQMVFIEPKVDAVREMIHNALTVKTPTMYVILDGNMSYTAKEALLKICEETPENAYICLLTSDNSSIPGTLYSRAGRYYMQPYTESEILEYAQIGKEEVLNSDIVVDLCETPGDVDKLYSAGVEKFYEFVEKVVDNIANVSPANALKIATNIDVKGDNPDKYDMKLFLRAFKSVCGKEMKKCVAENDTEGQMWYSTGIKVVTNTLNQMNVTGINKGALLDIFILTIRREWA